MHIGFRTSGGRGEYELVGRHGTLSARELDGWSLSWKLHGTEIYASGLLVQSGDSGKPRLRRHASNLNVPQVGRQMGSLLLLRPIRTAENLADSEPVICNRGYLLTRIGLGPEMSFDETTKNMVALPTYVQIKNNVAEQTIWVDQRWATIEQLHELVLEQELLDLSDPVVQLIDQHRLALEQGPATNEAVTVTNRIIRWLDNADVPLPGSGTEYVRNSILGNDASERVATAAPIALELLAADDIPMRIQSAREMRVSNVRGASGARFSRLVRDAWKHTCAFCGLRLPNNGPIGSGVDAAHILPWSRFDLDRVDNGICLCKLHHWAFDQMLLAIGHAGGEYFIQGTVLLELVERREREILARVAGQIPQGRLPESPTFWPNPAFIEELYRGINLTLYA